MQDRGRLPIELVTRLITTGQPLRHSRKPQIRYVIVYLTLFALWLLMSGLFKPILIAFGIISSALCVGLMARLGLLRADGFIATLRFRSMVSYLGWLTVEILKADWMIAKAILTEDDRNQRFIKVPTTQRSDIGKAVFANSITITPGTVTVETEADHFLIHALTDDAADRKALSHLGDRVTQLERSSQSGER